MVRERKSIGNNKDMRNNISENKINKIQRVMKKKNTAGKRKEGLKKKLNELTTLCGIEAFMISLESSSSPYDVNGTDDQVVAVDVWPKEPKEHHPIIQRYMQMRKEDREKHSSVTNISTTLNNSVLMEQQQNNKKIVVEKNVRDDDELDGLGVEELRDLKRVLENKLEEVRKRANVLKAVETLVPTTEVVVLKEDHQQQVVLSGNGTSGGERGGMVSCGWRSSTWNSSSAGTTGFGTLEDVNSMATKNVGFNQKQDAYNCSTVARGGCYFPDNHHHLMFDPMMGCDYMDNHLRHYDQLQEVRQPLDAILPSSSSTPLLLPPPYEDVQPLSQHFLDFNHLTAKNIENFFF